MDVNTTILQKIIKNTPGSSVVKLGVLVIAAIPTMMTISMHGNVLAVATTKPILSVGDPGYQLNVKVPSYPFGASTLRISITTVKGYTDHANVATSGVTSRTFNIPTNQGSFVQVCVSSDNSPRKNCDIYTSTGADMTVSLIPLLGDR